MWINEVEKPKPTRIELIKPAPSGKGYIVEGIDYSVFLWKNSVYLEKLLAIVSTMVAELKPHQPIVIVPDKEIKQGFTFRLESTPKNSNLVWIMISTDYHYIDPTSSKADPFLEDLIF
jgi:hypothetical protein